MADRKKVTIERAKSVDEDFVRGLLDSNKRKGKRAGPKLRVLSIDGGGMRGLIPARMIAYLEQALKEKSGNPDATVADYFDLVAGSSIGGVIAIMLFAVSPADGKPLFDGQQALRFIAQKGKDIFKLPYPQRLFSMVRGIVTPRYPSRFLEKMLEDYLGEMTLKDTQKAVVVPCYNLREASGFYFYNNLSRCANFKLTEVCRATTAAPTIFKPAKVTSVNGSQSFPAIDGGLVSNNPTLVAITHAVHDKERFPKVEGVQDMLVLSLGTGQFDQHYTYEEVRRWGALQWAKPIAKAIMDGISDMVDHTVSMAFIGNRENYVRIQVSGIPDDVAMDDPSPANVNKLLKIADELLEQRSMEHLVFGGRNRLDVTNRERLDWFAEQLVVQQLLLQEQQEQML